MSKKKESIFDLIKSAGSTRSLSETINDYELQLVNNPNSVDLLEKLSECYNLNGQYERAISICNDLLKVEENNKKGLNNLFFAYDRLEDYKEALEILKIYLESHKLKKDIQYQKLAFSEIFKSYFGNRIKKTNIGFLGEQPTEFVLKFFLSSDYPSHVFDINFSTSFQFSKIGWSPQNREVLKLVLDKYPQDVEMLNGLGYIYFNNENYSEAQKIYEKTLKINSYSGMTRILLCRLFLKMKNYEKAISQYSIVIEQNPSDHFKFMRRVAFEATDIDLKVLSLNLAARNGLGNCYLELGEYEKAIEQFSFFLELHKKGFSFVRTTSKAPIYKDLGVAYYALGEIKRAIKALKKSIKNDPSYIDPFECLGEIYIDINKTKQALEIFQHVVGNKSEDAIAWHMLSKCYYKSGVIDKAREANAKALTLEPDLTQAIKLKELLN